MTYCDAWEADIVPCGFLRLSAFGHWCCRALRVSPFSIDCVLSVMCSTGESDLVTVSCGRSQRAVLHDLAVNSMSLALALTISLDAFRDFAKRLRTCAIATISLFCALESSTLRNGQVCRPVSMVRMCLFAEALLALSCVP